jgi:hypothetical protein
MSIHTIPRRTVICAWRGRLIEADIEFVGGWATIYIEGQALKVHPSQLHMTEAPYYCVAPLPRHPDQQSGEAA